jgi:hypothetical protein
VASEALANQKMRLDKLQELLRDIWKTISPHERRRRVILFQFMDIEKKVRIEQQKLELLMKKEPLK